ncbi:hypothetical protein CBM2609_P110002 [Cupriavidus taiwanensis]|uniref:Uncharacterized protein n=2 Tax=Cupriavidus TaxID=106589 RepID=A0A375F7M7_9BURK|nr:hypothetical protein CBM2585_P120002 [Cupriavidus taiwanensis]SOZ40414.1 hypothetical protein CBM2605_P120002 [Cupriavidus neocaledonicus]SOY74352.1 hypothetical protein CBM2588_P140002 [Cupriavidus taiwanensis]SOY74355.1 hypothetical protein CBM2592_P150002 [Cupriavidus taiwanensis]SOY75289.1 hypothetical protein CBM2589_P120002 [Cupriavidus taiwanensis]
MIQINSRDQTYVYLSFGYPSRPLDSRHHCMVILVECPILRYRKFVMLTRSYCKSLFSLWSTVTWGLSQHAPSAA